MTSHKYAIIYSTTLQLLNISGIFLQCFVLSGTAVNTLVNRYLSFCLFLKDGFFDFTSGFMSLASFPPVVQDLFV